MASVEPFTMQTETLNTCPVTSEENIPDGISLIATESQEDDFKHLETTSTQEDAVKVEFPTTICDSIEEDNEMKNYKVSDCEPNQDKTEIQNLEVTSSEKEEESLVANDFEHDLQISTTTVEDVCKLSDDVPITESLTSTMDIIMSTTAQHIRQTITDVLKSREAFLSSSAAPDDFPSRLAGNLKEKIADFEKTVEKSNSGSSSDGFTSSLSNIPSNCDEAAASESTSEDMNNSSIQPLQNAQNENISDTEPDKGAVDKVEVDKETVVADMEPSNQSKTESSHSEKWEEEETTEVCLPPTEKSNVPLGDINEGEKSPKKSQKSNLSNKKKGEKTVDQVMKSLSSYGTTEERLSVLCKKHVEVLEEQRNLEARLKQSERYNIQLTREKEQLQAEHNRTVLAKSRLESLCRELQRQNKAIKEESLLRIREEEEKRKEVASKFQATLTDISNLMQENSQRNTQLKEENAELAKKLKSLVEHYEMWEKHMEKVVQQKDLEAQLAKAKLAKANLQQKQEAETFLREQQQLLKKMNELQKRCTDLSANELQMRNEFSLYTTKYEEFQSVLNKSNQVFASFKTDMETTSKKIKKLEKETGQWKQRWENSNRALLEMVADKQKRDQELLNSKQRILMLEKLCRALQAERNDLHNQLKKQGSPTEHILQPNTEEIESCSLPEDKDAPVMTCEEID